MEGGSRTPTGIFVASLLCFLAAGARLSTLPRYVDGPLHGSSVVIGFVIGCWALTACLTRPAAGHLADVRGRRFVLLGGLAICVCAGALLYVPLGVGGLIVSGLVLGVGQGSVYTAGVAWVVDLAAAEVRGRAITLFGLAVWGGQALGSVVGEALRSFGGYAAVWGFLTIAPLIGVAIVAYLEADGCEDGPSRREIARTSPRRFIPAAVRRPGVALMLSSCAFATMAGFVVLLLTQRGMHHASWAYPVFAGAILLSRVALASVPDSFGARRLVVLAGALQAIGLVVVATAPTLALALFGPLLVGIGFSLIFPVLALMVVRTVGETTRAHALGALSSFADIGFGVGAPLAGLAVGLAGGSYRGPFVAAAALCVGVMLLGPTMSRAPARALVAEPQS